MLIVAAIVIICSAIPLIIRRPFHGSVFTHSQLSSLYFVMLALFASGLWLIFHQNDTPGDFDRITPGVTLVVAAVGFMHLLISKEVGGRK